MSLQDRIGEIMANQTQLPQIQPRLKVDPFTGNVISPNGQVVMPNPSQQVPIPQGQGPIVQPQPKFVAPVAAPSVAPTAPAIFTAPPNAPQSSLGVPPPTVDTFGPQPAGQPVAPEASFSASGGGNTGSEFQTNQAPGGRGDEAGLFDSVTSAVFDSRSKSKSQREFEKQQKIQTAAMWMDLQEKGLEKSTSGVKAGASLLFSSLIG